MTTPSFKQMVSAKQIKRADAYKVRLQDIHEEPGFNLRLEGPDLDASIEAIADHIADGGMLPPLEVRPRADGGVWLVDGHRRTRAYRLAVERGVPLQNQADGEVWIEVKQFEGNDADRTLRIMSSADSKPLQPIEIAAGYARLAAFGWSNEQIAKSRRKTGTHVAQLLTLARSNSDVQRLVASGVTSAAVAVRAVKVHGEGAGAYLADQMEKAKAAGKRKVTAGTIAGKRAPMSLYRELFLVADELLLAGADHPSTIALRRAVEAIDAVELRSDRIAPDDSGADA